MAKPKTKEIYVKDVQSYQSRFKGQKWRESIDVSDFIDNNYREYKGDDSFLAGKSKKTAKVWAVCEKLLAKERKVHLLDVDLKHISGINNFPAGYIDRKNEVIFGLQSDKPLKRSRRGEPYFQEMVEKAENGTISPALFFTYHLPRSSGSCLN